MSFKRDGDDYQLLNNLKRRRVSDLLVSHIPEDEAILLKNGRYCCSICTHKPIFDTMDMLAVHRKGKKHLFYLSKHIQKQQELKELIEKRRHEEYLKTGKAVTKELSGGEHSNASSKNLLKSVPYNSCSKKKYSPFNRKQTIIVKENDDKSTGESLKGEVIKKPPSANSVLRSYLKSMQRKREFGQMVNKKRSEVKHLADIGKELEGKASVNTQSVEEAPTEPPSASTIIEQEEKKKKREYYLSLRQSGWKKNLKGEWIKDEDAEFDSDEEIPSEYPT